MILPENIVAFLQNPWFPPGTDERHLTNYQIDVDFRRRVLSMSMTGKRLVEAFGQEWYHKIWWDNANPVAAEKASGALIPNETHIKMVVEQQKPELILTFGILARDGLHRALWLTDMTWIPLLHCHHPNARVRTQDDLNNFAKDTKQTASIIIPIWPNLHEKIG